MLRIRTTIRVRIQAYCLVIIRTTSMLRIRVKFSSVLMKQGQHVWLGFGLEFR